MKESSTTTTELTSRVAPKKRGKGDNGSEVQRKREP